MASIQKSVGRGGVNQSADVKEVQGLLNRNIGRLTPLAPLRADGVIGPATISAIEEFQRRILGLPKPDGLVDPGGKTLQALSAAPSGPAKTKSGQLWVSWANVHAANSNSIEDLSEPFRANAKAFIKALEAAGAKVGITTTRRHTNRAYLFHWSWLISQGKSKASAATARAGVDIQWDHGNDVASKAGAQEMVNGFGLAVPPKSDKPPSLTSNHIEGRAIDMAITWTGTLKVAKKDGTLVEVPGGLTANANTKLHGVGASYGVKKLLKDEPHWSDDGG